MKKYTKEFLIEEVQRYYNTYNKVPTRKDIDVDKEYPSVYQYGKFFTSWKDVLNSSGFETKPVLDDYKDNIISEYINGVPLKEIANKYECEQGTILNFIDKYNIPRRNNRWTKEQIQILKDKYSSETWDNLLELLFPFSKEDIEKKACKLKIKRDCYYGMYSQEDIDWLLINYSTSSNNDILKRFPNRTLQAIRTKASELGVKIREFWSEEELEKLKELYPYEKDNYKLADIFNRSRDAIVLTAGKLGLKKEFLKSDTEETKEQKRIEMIKDLQDFANELGRTPFQSEVAENKNIACETSYRRFFGSYSEACVQAGLEPNMNIFGDCKPVLLSKNNDICLSKYELYITNIFIDNNLKYIKEALYKDIIKDDYRCGLKRCDWLIDGIIVEYFGLMDKDYYKKKVIEKMQICKDNNVRLIDLYPNDIINNFAGLREKFYNYNINLNINYLNQYLLCCNY